IFKVVQMKFLAMHITNQKLSFDIFMRKTSDDGGESPDHDVEVPEVDLFQLQVNTLRRYKRHYKIQTRPGLNKAQLAETVSRHFRNIPVNEKETLTYFIYMVKSSKSRLDQKPDASKQVE
uniref:SAP30 like n=1 Tax=Cyprinus carpio TaxID=7962 RepID=A0A8C1LKP7_CYPCA